MVVNKTYDPMTRRISSEDQYKKRLRKAKQRIEQRLDGSQEDQGRPMFAATNIRMELADKVRPSALEALDWSISWPARSASSMPSTVTCIC